MRAWNWQLTYRAGFETRAKQHRLEHREPGPACPTRYKATAADHEASGARREARRAALQETTADYCVRWLRG